MSKYLNPSGETVPFKRSQNSFVIIFAKGYKKFDPHSQAAPSDPGVRCIGTGSWPGPLHPGPRQGRRWPPHQLARIQQGPQGQPHGRGARLSAGTRGCERRIRRLFQERVGSWLQLSAAQSQGQLHCKHSFTFHFYFFSHVHLSPLSLSLPFSISFSLSLLSVSFYSAGFGYHFIKVYFRHLIRDCKFSLGVFLTVYILFFIVRYYVHSALPQNHISNMTEFISSL